MARKLFISFLGTIAYKECIYHDNKKDYTPTPFIQTATLEQIGVSDWTETDAVCIFVTDNAKKQNWDKSISERKGSNNQTIPYHGLEKELNDMQLKANFESVPIVDGKDEDEIWQIFQTVFNKIQDGDEIYIDLTHAFRYLPMLVLVLSNYSKFLKHTTIKHLSYGNWEARDEETNRAPIIDLLPLTMLQDWTSAAADFLKYGYAGELKKVINNKLTPLLKDDTLRTQNVTDVNSLGANLESYVEERITCRGIDIAKAKAATNLVNRLNEIKDTGIAPLNPIFHKLKSSIFSPSDIPSRCIEAARWCYEKHLYQQAITILQEGINTFFCLRHSIKIDDEDKRDYVGKAFHKKYIAFNKKYKEIYSDEKNNDCCIVEDAFIKSLLEDKLLNDANIVNQYTILSGTRNDFNHSGYRSRRVPMKPKQIKDKIKAALDFFYPILILNESREQKEKVRKIFLNISNHPSDMWGNEQIKAALKYGEIIDIPFPNITSDAAKSDIEILAQSFLQKINEHYADTVLTVHIMGEMTFTYHMISLLKECGIRCVASCSERIVKDLGDGKRISQFSFEKFREY